MIRKRHEGGWLPDCQKFLSLDLSGGYTVRQYIKLYSCDLCALSLGDLHPFKTLKITPSLGRVVLRNIRTVFCLIQPFCLIKHISIFIIEEIENSHELEEKLT